MQITTRRSLLVTVLAFVCAHLACAQTLANNEIDRSFGQEFGEHFLDAYWKLNPEYAIHEGYYKYADETVIPDDLSRKKAEDFIVAWEAKLHGYNPQALNTSNRSDWAVVDLELRTSLWQLKTLKEWEWNPSHYNIAGPIARILESNYSSLDDRLRVIYKRLNRVPDYYAAAKLSIKNPSSVHTQLAIDQNLGALKMIGEGLEKKVKESGLSSLEKEGFVVSLNHARKAVTDYITWLKEVNTALGKTGGRSFRLGAALYNEKFNFENPGSLGAEALYAHALSEKDSVTSKMDVLADTLWPKYLKDEVKPKDKMLKIARVIDVVSRQHSEPTQYVNHLRVLLADLTQYVTTNHLVKLDPSLPLGVREMPAYMRGISFGNAESPGPYDAATPGYFNIIPPETYPADKVESLLREYNDWTTQIFTIHEAMPGHLVQLQHANKSPSRIRAVFSNSTMIEGWAVFSERMMLESGWGRNAPELMLMYWKWYLRSVLNTIVDHEVHEGTMGEEGIKQLIVHDGFQSEEEAAIKWRRAQLSSVQLTCYFSGFTQILAFRDKLKDQQGEGYSVQNFNETFLKYGSVPVGTIIDLMLSDHD